MPEATATRQSPEVSSVARVPVAASLLASVFAGIPILVGFFVWHWFNIAPVWGVLIEAAVSFPVGALGIAWAWRAYRQGGNRGGVGGGIAFGAVFVGGLLIAELIGLARGRQPNAVTASGIAIEVLLAAAALLAVVPVGWWLTHGRGTIAFLIAGIALDLHLGGTVMHLGGSGIALSLFAILFSSYLVAGLLLGSLEPFITSLVARPPRRSVTDR